MLLYTLGKIKANIIFLAKYLGGKMEKKIIVKKRKLQYRKPNQKHGEQYSISLPIDMVNDMEIVQDDRNIEIIYNPILKEIKIKKDKDK